MSVVDRFRKLPTPMIVLHIASKAIIGIGLGAALAEWLGAYGWWIVVLGVALSIPPIYIIYKSE